ncbi:DUF1963 domain-containing protein [Streptomyces sp. NBC_01381]|uniref:DUF1963 domain-containing protein n=1 Tax=Streptomyces sp. NBC_01381 TaxID=2903845 RepID=UPI002B1DB010|nr:DUF1963 domain-containing protein [Streptomyces sp. NBC_01381]
MPKGPPSGAEISSCASRTTPPPLLDVEALFPAIAPLRREAVRLHPRRGQPGPRDSSVGGAPAWPAAEAWPHCGDSHPRTRFAPVDDGVAQAMVPVLQLYARDVPELPFPEGTDVLQVLWCPFDHEAGYVPRPEIFWRDSARCEPLVEEPPRPVGARDDYLPDPCVLHPERVVEYPSWDLDDEVAEELEEAFEEMEDRAEEDGSPCAYWSHLSVAPGIKVGGYPSWTQDPYWPTCPGPCGQRMRHLVTIKSAEFDGASWRRWVPVEDRSGAGEDGWSVFALPYEERNALQCAPGIMLGDMGGMYLFVCAHGCPDMPFRYHSDCS